MNRKITGTVGVNGELFKYRGEYLMERMLNF
jgi:hypothetical protein